MGRHYSALPPGLPMGDIEDLHDCGVWWYTVPSKNGNIKRWAFALKHPTPPPGETIYEVGRCIGGFLTREDAHRAGVDAACARELKKREE